MELSDIKTSKIIWRYMIPQMIGLVFNSVYFIVDGVFIGQRLGTQALAAAGVAVPVVEISIALAMMLSVGTGVRISAAAGSGKPQQARDVFNTSVAFTLAVSLVMALVGGLLAQPMAVALGAGPQLVQGTAVYIRIFLLFSPFMVFSYALGCYVRNDGAPALAMAAMIVGAASNVLLDWLFIYPLNMGIAGAALATGLGPVFSVAMLLPHFVRKKGMLWFQRPRFSARVAGGIVAAGLPAFVTEFSIGIVTLLYNLAIVKNGLGQNGLAGYMVIGYAALICLTAFLGAAQGIQPPVSYWAGAGMQKRIGGMFRAAAAFCLALAAALYAALYFGAGAFFGLFITGDAQLVRQTLYDARVYFLCLPFAALNILAISVWQAAGDKGRSLVVSLCRCSLPLMGMLALLPRLLGPQGLWWAAPAAEAAALVLAAALWLWQRRAATEKPAKGLPPKAGRVLPGAR